MNILIESVAKGLDKLEKKISSIASFVIDEIAQNKLQV